MSLEPGQTRLSLSGGSGLPMSTLLQCPHKFNLIRQGWRRWKKPLYFPEGSIFHHAAEKIIKGSSEFSSVQKCTDFAEDVFRSGKWTDPETERITEFDTEALAYPNKKLKNGEPSPIKKVDHAIQRMPHLLFKVYMEKINGTFDGVTETEKLVETNFLINPATGEPDDECKMFYEKGLVWCGRIDLVQKGGIADLKTSSPSAVQTVSAKNSEQLSLYGYLQTIDTGDLVTDASLHVFTKHVKRCDYFYKPTKRTIADYMEIFKLLKMIGRDYLACEKNGYEKVGHLRTGCKDMYSQLCEFHPICFPDKYKDPEKAQENLLEPDKGVEL